MNGRLIRGSDFTGLNAPAQSDGSYYRVQLLSSGQFRIAKNIGGSFDSWNDFLTNADLEVNTAKIGNCAAKTVTTYYVKFDTPFSSAPIVVATLDLHTENANNSDITITVSNVTNAGFNIRYINNTDSQISNGTVNWIAIRK